MNAALLRQEKIELWSPVLVSDDFGHYNTEWCFEGTCRAGVIHDNMNRVIDNDEVVYDMTTELVVRSYVKVEEDWQIRWDDKKWRIISITSNRYYNDKSLLIQKIIE